MLRNERDGAVDTAVIMETVETVTAGGEKVTVERRRSAANGEEVRKHTGKHMEEWMGSKKECWFHFEDGCVDGPREPGQRWVMGDRWHLIARDDEVGRAFRRRVVEGVLTAEDLRTIPECFHRMLPYLRRKESKLLARRVEEGDYDRCGLMRALSRMRWDELWRAAKGGKRGGGSALSVWSDPVVRS